MDKGASIKDLEAGKEISGVFLIADAQLAKTKKNDPYWRLRIADATGSVNANIWKPLSREIQTIANGSYGFLRGIGDSYNNSLQLKISELRLLAPDEVQTLNIAQFLKSSSRDIEAMFAELRSLADAEFVHEPWHKLVFSVFDDAAISSAFKQAPASMLMHQGWAGGLLEHTSNVFALCRQVADHYGELDRQALLAGALLHDIGKTRELSSGPNTVYTTAGELLGHIFIGLHMLEPFIAASGLAAPLADHLRHLILSHHGMLEYGSPVLPKTREAMALHYMDDLDAKMSQCCQILETVKENEGSGRQNLLRRNIFRIECSPTRPATMKANCTEATAEPNLEDYDDLIPEQDANEYLFADYEEPKAAPYMPEQSFAAKYPASEASTKPSHQVKQQPELTAPKSKAANNSKNASQGSFF